MDDFNLSTLHESKSEWAGRLMMILTPLVIDGLRSIFNSAVQDCVKNEEPEKYLQNFQNMLGQIHKWSNATVENERKRIIERSGCKYLEDLVTCVHIVQLKILTAMRVGSKQKKININIPNLDVFIHNVYINTARKVYNNVYLYENVHVPPLQIQKNYRELEIIIQECILKTIRESIPVETILRAYMDETIEEETTEEIQEQIVQIDSDSASASASASLKHTDEVPSSTNPELNELREMQKILTEEPKKQNEIVPEHSPQLLLKDEEPPIIVDIGPLSRPPSVETLPPTETDDSFKLKVDDSENVTLDFDEL
jgi:hypothetical protein